MGTLVSGGTEMTDQEFMDRAVMLLEKEYDSPEKWHYLSFADEHGFLGGVIIKAHGITDAVMKTHRLGINPGGSVMSWLITDEKMLPNETFRNRLLSREEVDNMRPDTQILQ
jgi:hypothetical protein